MLMRLHGIAVPDDPVEFCRVYAGILWYEERLANLVAVAVHHGLWGKK